MGMGLITAGSHDSRSERAESVVYLGYFEPSYYNNMHDLSRNITAGTPRFLKTRIVDHEFHRNLSNRPGHAPLEARPQRTRRPMVQNCVLCINGLFVVIQHCFCFLPLIITPAHVV